MPQVDRLVRNFPYDEYVRIQVVAKEAGVASSVIHRAIKNSDVATHSNGRHFYIAKTDRDAVLAAASALIEKKHILHRTRNTMLVMRLKADYVYLMSSGDYVKIGKADAVHRRRKELQVGNPVPIKIEAYFFGDERLEEEIHTHFRDLHVQGDWFRNEGDLAEFVARLAAKDSPLGATTEFKDAWRFRQRTNCTESRNLSQEHPSFQSIPKPKQGVSRI